MISSTRSTISSIVVLFSSINYMLLAFVHFVEEEASTTHTKSLERCSRRPDRCLSGWYHHERLLGHSKSRLECTHQSLAMLSPPDPCFVDLDDVRQRTQLGHDRRPHVWVVLWGRGHALRDRSWN
jgi:hypothetical protein